MRVKMRSTVCQSRAGGRHERTHLRHQHDQCGLPQVGGFASHVGAGDEQDRLSRRVEIEIVGDKAVVRPGKLRLLDNRMAAFENLQQLRFVVKLRTAVVAQRRKCAKSSSTSISASASAVWRMRRASAAMASRSSAKRRRSISTIFSSASRTLVSYSFSSGVVKRSAPTRVCLRS